MSRLIYRDSKIEHGSLATEGIDSPFEDLWSKIVEGLFKGDPVQWVFVDLNPKNAVNMLAVECKVLAKFFCQVDFMPGIVDGSIYTGHGCAHGCTTYLDPGSVAKFECTFTHDEIGEY